MALISTKELFDKFFEGKDAQYNKKVRPQVDRPELYTYEREIGKQLVDMNVDELFGMLNSFINNRAASGSSFSISYASYDQMASMYRALFNYYIYNYEVIINPWNDKAMRGATATERLAQGKTAFTTASMNHIIDAVRDHYDQQRADYLECIILLFYNGFATADEIVTMKRSDLDTRNHAVKLSGRTVKLSDRCWELLHTVNRMTEMPGHRGYYNMLSWQDSIFKFSVRPKETENFAAETVQEVSARINRMLKTMIQKKLNLDVCYRALYLLGFYDTLVSWYGKERTRELFKSFRNTDNVRELESAAMRYGMGSTPISHIKKNMRPFIE